MTKQSKGRKKCVLSLLQDLGTELVKASLNKVCKSYARTFLACVNSFNLNFHCFFAYVSNVIPLFTTDQSSTFEMFSFPLSFKHVKEMNFTGFHLFISINAAHKSSAQENDVVSKKWWRVGG